MGRLSLRRLGPVLLSIFLLLPGCRRAPESQDLQLLAMDTIMSLTAYGDGAGQALSDAREEICRLEKLLSVTDEGSDIYAVNHSGGQPVSLSRDTGDVLAFALEMAAQTGGAMDPTIYPLVTAWGFTTGSYQVPDRNTLDALLPLVDYSAVEYDPASAQVTLPQGMELDLGSVAKGWCGDRVLDLWRQAGLTSGILRLGGNIQTLGAKPDGSPWVVGIQDPAGEGYVAKLSVTDLAVITSGGYQRYFEQAGQTYWHLIDPSTGFPARTGLTSVTVVGPSGARCDALSTALFVMGLEEAAQFWRDNRDFEAVFILEDGSIAITVGLEGSFALMQGYEDREVTVLS